MKKILALAFFFSISFYSYSQSKMEIEERIEKEEAPFLAQKFIDSLYFSSKIKWYLEKDYIKTTYEAKVKEKGQKYSIEFDSLGYIEDIELEIKWKRIPTSTQNAICEKLHTEFEKFKIKKIQIQYIGQEKDLLNFKTSTENLIIKYEIVVKGKKESQTSFYEYLFSERGKLEQKLQFDFRNIDHLEY
jgi:hypothetical protein